MIIKIRRTVFGRWHLYIDGLWIASYRNLNAMERLCSGIAINEIAELIAIADNSKARVISKNFTYQPKPTSPYDPDWSPNFIKQGNDINGDTGL